MAEQYYLNKEGAFIIEDYQHKKVFSNFFPGVAGLWGVPMWAFYVNRGQAISSFGIESKDKAILEFQPANRSYRLTSIQGFRTFLKVSDKGKSAKFYEPFANSIISPYKVNQRMIITSYDLTIEETNLTLGLKISVNYFTLPQEPYAALIRRVNIENISKKSLQIECIDGLPAINPYGLKDWLSKHISRTVEAWTAVRNVSKKAPFYQFKVEVADTPQVTPIAEGNFYFAFNSKAQLLDMIVEASCVFGQASDFLTPESFLSARNFKVDQPQQTSNRTPCAFSFNRFSIKPKEVQGWTAFAGFAHDLTELNEVVKKALRKDYVDEKAKENKGIIDGVKDYCFTQSASNNFNEYCGQTFLDNILRGGLPISLATAKGAVSFNVYSRKHGDLERDYNFFTLAPTFFSQGNGNYRDVNQNRRNDIWFNRDVADSSIINFMNLVQADGYNPLIVKGLTFYVTDPKAIENIINEFNITQEAGVIRGLLQKGFMPGDLLKLILRKRLIKGAPQNFLAKVLSVSQKKEQAEFGEGFWSDHWTYNLDLIESYLGLYPERLKELLLEKKNFTFYLSDHYVLPRSKKYFLTDSGVRQYHSLAEHDKEVKAKEKEYQLRVKAGIGEPYQTTLLVKMICLLANKAATLDPSGIGIEMEANKPNWYDALNGLPGLLGSSICESFELKRWALFVKNSLEQLQAADTYEIEMFEELADFLNGLTHLLSTEKDNLKYWQKSNDLKELYRQSVRYGITGSQKVIALGEIRRFLEGIIIKVDNGLNQARYDNGLFASYFYHEVIEHEVLDKAHQGQHHVRPLKFKRHDLPLFLEGFVHALRVSDETQAIKLFQGIKKSPLYDKKLGMYKVNANLSGETEEIGRTRVFPAGWLENESIWLHMEYKYLLELLRRGLAKEFYQEIKTTFIPFSDPKRYGRSILENSSFIVSSAHEDHDLHGQGFVARLSGSTAEFLHMWLLMNLGHRPFTVNEGELNVTFAPLLANWLFTTQKDHLSVNTYAFKFLAKTLVVYHNPKRRDTFGPQAVKASKIVLTYPKNQRIEIEGATVKGHAAEDIRQGKLDRIDITLE